MNVLIISRTPWDEGNSFGSTFSNIFSYIDEITIMNVCCGSGIPNNKIVKRHFQITEKKLLKNFLFYKSPTGSLVNSTPWDEGNSFGSTFSNIFSYIDEITIMNVCCGPGIPNNKIVKRHFQITEKKLLKNFLFYKSPTGSLVNSTTHNEVVNISKSSCVNFAKKKRWQIFFWLRDCIWLCGRWKSKLLIDAIKDFSPDIMYTPIYDSLYMNHIQCEIHKDLNIPMIGHVTDDVYLYNKSKLSPLYYINKFFVRKQVKKVIAQCCYIDTFTQIQKNTYEKIFHKPFHLLYKSADFNGEMPVYTTYNKPLQLLYTGNLGSNRWKTLASIGKALEKINQNTLRAQLIIYSHTPLTRAMKKAFELNKNIVFMGSVPGDAIKTIQEAADILIHVESFELESQQEVKMSFSTKIVDYLQRGKPLFVVGPTSIAPIDYFIQNDSAIVALAESDIEEKLLTLLNSPLLRKEYAEKAWLCGKRNHDKEKVKENFIENLKEVLK